MFQEKEPISWDLSFLTNQFILRVEAQGSFSVFRFHYRLTVFMILFPVPYGTTWIQKVFHASLSGFPGWFGVPFHLSCWPEVH